MVSVIFHSLLMYTLLISIMLHSSLFSSGNSLSSLSVMCRITSLSSVREDNVVHWVDLVDASSSCGTVVQWTTLLYLQQKFH